MKNIPKDVGRTCLKHRITNHSGLYKIQKQLSTLMQLRSKKGIKDKNHVSSLNKKNIACFFALIDL